MGLVLQQNPFYVESGGQVSDQGTVRGDAWTLTVANVAKVGSWTAIFGPLQGTFPSDPESLFVSAEVDISMAAYVTNTIAVLTPDDLLHGLSKSGLFAVLIVVIGAVNGSLIKGGSDGVGRVTTRSVVHASSAIIITDMIFGFLATQ